MRRDGLSTNLAFDQVVFEKFPQKKSKAPVPVGLDNTSEQGAASGVWAHV
jgi:hypothetical protein